MFNIVLHNPQIPANTGNVIRLCANTGSNLHLILPLGFTLDDKRLKRAGLDYHEYAAVKCYNNLDEYLIQNNLNTNNERIFVVSTKACNLYTNLNYHQNDTFIFGAETCGLPLDIRQKFTGIYLPMQTNSRSLNLSNSVAIVLFEALRQVDFANLNTNKL